MDELKVEHLKGLCVINLTKYLMVKDHLNHEDAYKNLLASETYKILMNTDSSLYLEPDSYILKAFEIEASDGKEGLYSFISNN